MLALLSLQKNINFTGENHTTEKYSFKGIKIEKDGDVSYVTSTYGTTLLRDRVSAIDMDRRLTSGEIDLQDLAYNYFAYVLD